MKTKMTMSTLPGVIDSGRSCDATSHVSARMCFGSYPTCERIRSTAFDEKSSAWMKSEGFLLAESSGKAVLPAPAPSSTMVLAWVCAELEEGTESDFVGNGSAAASLRDGNS